MRVLTFFVFLGRSNDMLPPFLRDRMELAAGVCSMLAVRLTVEAVNGSLSEAGVDERCQQLATRLEILKNFFCFSPFLFNTKSS